MTPRSKSYATKLLIIYMNKGLWLELYYILHRLLIVLWMHTSKVNFTYWNNRAFIYAKTLNIIIRNVFVNITKSYKDNFDVYARSLECFFFCYLISSLMILSFEIQCQKCILSCDVWIFNLIVSFPFLLYNHTSSRNPIASNKWF